MNSITRVRLKEEGEFRPAFGVGLGKENGELYFLIGDPVIVTGDPPPHMAKNLRWVHLEDIDDVIYVQPS